MSSISASVRMPFSRARKAAAPQFPADAKITVTEREGMSPKTAKRKPEKERQVVVSFPAAIGADDLSRVFDYEVAAEYVEDDCVKPVRTKRVYQPGVQLNVRRISPTVTCVFVVAVPPVHFAYKVVFCATLL